MEEKQTSFTFEIDNFLEKEAVIESPKFTSGGCEWFVRVHPKWGDGLSLKLCVANPESLRLGWKRRASFSFVLLDQSSKELYRTPEWYNLFCAQISTWGFFFPRKNVQEKVCLEKNKLIFKVEVKVVEVVDEGDVTGNETFNVNGFQVLGSQVDSVLRLFKQHPDIAINFRPNSQLMKTTYMNLLLSLIETLNKPPHSLSVTELSNAHSELIDLTNVGFKLDWLGTKFDEVSLERKKENGDVSRVQELEEHIKKLKLELDKEYVNYATYGAKICSSEKTMWKLQCELNDAKDIAAAKDRDFPKAARDKELREAAKDEELGETAKDLRESLVHSWNEWKVRLGFADFRYEKI
ncbi:unnamed protein product [Microthlaspi erraticum]|uniref:MATH domain-containing protein n=1 Tax=Microthlaspi erraticum TaxID=1685480 RepID=A0A6D2K3V6_9BRAS|nr:unnamed protein product [Microthlaspi erraticum]